MNKKGKILTLSVALIVFVVFFSSLVEDYFKDRAISANPSVVDASIVDTQIIKKRKKGVTRTSYDFTYEFEVEGKKYVGEFGASQNKAKPYLDKGMVSIMYNKDDPNKNDLAKYVDTSKSIMDLVWGFIKSVFFGLLLGFVIGVFVSYKLGWLKSEDESKSGGEEPNPSEA